MQFNFERRRGLIPAFRQVVSFSLSAILRVWKRKLTLTKSSEPFADIHDKMATKGDLNKVIDIVGALAGQVTSMETDIKTIKGDVNNVRKRVDGVEKLAERKVSHAEFNDRLRPIEQKLGIPSPQ